MKWILMSALTGILSTTALAFPGWDPKLKGPVERADEASLLAFDFNGILALSNCSGSLVRFDDSLATDPAMVLTNGHCTGMITPGKVILNQRASRSFDILSSQAKKLGSVRSDLLLVATMTKTDLALYRLTESYEAIETRFGIQALTFARLAPAVDTKIEVLSGYWKRGYACAIEAIVPTLKEGNWTFQDSLRYSRPGCETIGGTSGSPVVEEGTRLVVAINNTGNESGRACTVNNPCEVAEDGSIFYQKGLSYAQQTYWLYSCRTELGQLDLTLPGCLMPKPSALRSLSTFDQFSH